MTQRQEFRLPDVGEGLTEAEIVKWHVHPGDTVADGQTIIEIETAKSVVELPSPYHGVVTELLVEEGATVDVGTPIIVVGDPDAAPDDDAPAQGDAEPSDAGPAPGASDESARDGAEPEKREPVLVGYGVKAGATKRRARRTPVDTGAGAQHVAPAAPVPDPAAPAPAPDGRSVVVLAKPPVRKLALESVGEDLARLCLDGAAMTLGSRTQCCLGPCGQAANQDLFHTNHLRYRLNDIIGRSTIATLARGR